MGKKKLRSFPPLVFTQQRMLEAKSGRDGDRLLVQGGDFLKARPHGGEC